MKGKERMREIGGKRQTVKGGGEGGGKHESHSGGELA